MFIGEYQHTIDEKRRMSIPSKFRKDLGDGAVITKGLESSLVIYPKNQWKVISEKVGNLPLSQKEGRAMARIILGGASEVEFDKIGRILIPDYLKEFASLQKDAVIIGMYNRIEIWDAKVWSEYKTKVEKEMDESIEKLKDVGI